MSVMMSARLSRPPKNYTLEGLYSTALSIRYRSLTARSKFNLVRRSFGAGRFPRQSYYGGMSCLGIGSMQVGCEVRRGKMLE